MFSERLVKLYFSIDGSAGAWAFAPLVKRDKSPKQIASKK
jgi:hypothetical protein